MPERVDLEVLEVRQSNSNELLGTVGREAAERLGVDTRPIDHGRIVWFTREQSEALRADPTWRDGAP
jgi:hypothetical protein